MTRRIWTAGEANLGFAEPFWGFVQVVSEQWQPSVDLLPWQVAFVDGVPTACTLARWQDEVAGDVTVAIALRPGGESEVDWGMVADAERDWVAHAVPPWIMLGFEGDGFCDPSGAYLSRQPATLPVDTSPGSRELVEAMVAGFASPARTTGLLAVTVDSRKTAERVGHIGAVNWPGVLSLIFVSEAGRAALNALLPDRQIPAAGARFYPAAGDGLADVEISRSALRNRPEVLTALLGRVMRARAASTPTGMAAVAAALLQHVRRPDPSVAEDIPPGASEQVITTVQAQLTAALERAATAEAAAGHADRGRLAALEEAQRLKRLLPAAEAGPHEPQPSIHDLQLRLAELSAERDLLDRLLEHAESERDTAVHQRGVLALRTQAAHLWQDLAEDDGAVAATFADLLEEAAQRYGLLQIVADPVVAGALDAYPKASAWRRKAADALATMGVYTQAKKQARAGGQPPGPHLADLLAFAHSGAPGVMISANIVALAESDQVMNTDRYRAARTFAVHPQTDPSGRAVFAAHIKLDRGKAPAPRLHFLDDTHNTGLLYVGWLGPHLITGRTN
ncbi:hypothetical protein [Streptosporangium canum]|uniref:hypothetical protein n=1 Tax=Streptosporangium canum TaxID=324952 RepID=UPI00378FCC38